MPMATIRSTESRGWETFLVASLSPALVQDRQHGLILHHAANFSVIKA